MSGGKESDTMLLASLSTGRATNGCRTRPTRIRSLPAIRIQDSPLLRTSAHASLMTGKIHMEYLYRQFCSADVARAPFLSYMAHAHGPTEHSLDRLSVLRSQPLLLMPALESDVTQWP